MHDMQFFMAGSVSCQQSGIYNIFKKKKKQLRKTSDMHLMQQFLQLLLQLHKVPGGDQAFLGLVQTVSGKLQQLVLDEAQHSIS